MNNVKVLKSASCSAGLLVWNIIVNIIAVFFITLVLALLNIIPILGTILFLILAPAISIFCFVDLILLIIGSIRCKAVLTEDGIHGNSYRFGTFDLSFDKITNLSFRKKMITISYMDENSKIKKVKIYGISKAKAFYKACNEQMISRRTAPAQAEAQA